MTPLKSDQLIAFFISETGSILSHISVIKQTYNLAVLQASCAQDNENRLR